MTEHKSFAGGRWWRFNRYEFRGGYIVPAPNASLEEYDPWAMYAAEKRTTGGQSPYVSLFQTLEPYEQDIWLLDRAFDGRDDLPDAALNDIARWCSQYGLLGILPQSLEYAEMPPVWTDIPTAEDAIHYALCAVASYSRYARRNGRWIADLYDAEVDSESRQPNEADEGHSVPPDLWMMPKRFVSRLKASPEPRPTTDLRSYFPKLAPAGGGSFRFPLPLTEAFWNVYAEPAAEFCRSALLLRDAIRGLSAKSESISEGERAEHKEYVAALIEGISVTLSEEAEPVLEETWICPSLIAAFAQMAVQDLISGASLLRCACCNLPFMATAYQARYCSQSCAWRDRKRKARATARAEQDRIPTPAPKLLARRSRRSDAGRKKTEEHR
jgi:hypothetical protein